MEGPRLATEEEREEEGLKDSDRGWCANNPTKTEGYWGQIANFSKEVGEVQEVINRGMYKRQ